MNRNKTYYNKYPYKKSFKSGKYSHGHHFKDNKEEIDDDICIKCLQKEHGEEECPHEKCYLCNGKNHNIHSCPLKRKNQNNYKNKYIALRIPKCTNCLNNGHESIDCLIKPNDIIIKNPFKIPLCRFCKSSNHYICPFNESVYEISDYDSDKIIINEDSDVMDSKKNINNNYHNKSYIKNYKVNKNSFISLFNYFCNENKKYEKEVIIIGKISNNISKEQIKNNNFCCKCGKLHYSKDCGKHFSKKYIKEEDGDYFIKLRQNNIHKKNPLKFEPFEKPEYRINHHDIRYNYYDQDDSSGESFSNMYKEKTKKFS